VPYALSLCALSSAIEKLKETLCNRAAATELQQSCNRAATELSATEKLCCSSSLLQYVSEQSFSVAYVSV
jgi:hypothetical protein